MSVTLFSERWVWGGSRQTGPAGSCNQLKGQAQGLGSLDQPLISAGNREALALGHGQIQGITTYAAAEIAAGELFTEANIRIVRPDDGAPPHLFEQLLGRQARQDYSCGTPLSLDQLL